MKRVICILALVVFSFPLYVPTSAADDPLSAVLKRGGYTVSLDLKVRKKKRDSLQRVLEDILGDDRPNAFATGFVVGDGLVMTSYHAVSGGFGAEKKRLLGFSQDDQLEVEAHVNGCEATILKADPDGDLALLHVCGARKQAGMPAFQASPGRGDELLVIARPNGNRSVRRGVFSGTYNYRGKEYWSAKIEGRDGFSGSPVYNERGEIVGVFSGYDSTQKVALISPGTRAQKLLEDYAAGLNKP